MRIAFVHKRYALDGGTERFLDGLARRLAERGHQVTVYCATFDPRFTAIRSIRLQQLRVRSPWSLLRRVLLFIAAATRIPRADHDVVVHLGRTGPGDAWRAGGGCHRRLHRLIAAARPSTWSRRAFVADLEQRFLLWHERHVLKSGVPIIVPSARAREDFLTEYASEAFGGPALAERIHVLPNGVDIERFHPKLRSMWFGEKRDELGLGPEELVLITVASDFWRKGVDTVIRALAIVSTKGPWYRLLVLGEDADQDRYVRLADELGLQERVLFLGRQSEPERLYAACDLLVAPTRFDAFANVTLEALAAGLPVVTSQQNGAVDALPETDAVAVVDDADDAEILARAIDHMLDPESLPARREAARKAAERCGDHDAIAGWETFLQQLSTTRRA